MTDEQQETEEREDEERNLRSDSELAQEALALIQEARDERKEKGSISRERWEALRSQIELLALEAEEPDDIREVTAEPILWLEPGGKFEDDDDDDETEDS